MSKSIFRKASLERLSSPEQIDCLLVVGNAKSWLIISGVFLMIAASILWGFFGEMPDYVEGNGMSRHSQFHLQCHAKVLPLLSSLQNLRKFHLPNLHFPIS